MFDPTFASMMELSKRRAMHFSNGQTFFLFRPTARSAHLRTLVHDQTTSSPSGTRRTKTRHFVPVNMDLAGLAKKLQHHAEQAKMAAKNFNFDDMAAQDDYIHSDSLNVKRREHAQSQGTSKNRSLWPLSSGVAAQTSSLSEFDRTPLIQQSAAQQANAISPLLPVVHDAMQTHPLKSDSSCRGDEERLPLHVGSDSESDEDDPIMRQITRQRTTRQTPEETKRNKFMDDLDEHISKENTGGQLQLAVHARVENEKADRPGSWISGLLGRRKLLNEAATELAPLARKKKSEDRSDIEEGVDIIVASSNVLRPEELAELRMLKSASPGYSESCAILLRQHPRETFICLTLLLCIYAYLRGRLVIDDIH